MENQSRTVLGGLSDIIAFYVIFIEQKDHEFAIKYLFVTRKSYKTIRNSHRLRNSADFFQIAELYGYTDCVNV